MSFAQNKNFVLQSSEDFGPSRKGAAMSLKTWVSAAVVLFVLSSHVAAGGLVGWWKFDEGAGREVVDSSGNGRHGKVFGGAAWVDGFIGKGALNISGGGVEIADSPLLRPQHFTVSIWVRFAESQTEFARLFQKGNDNRETINILGGGAAQDGRPSFNKVAFSIYPGHDKDVPAISVPQTLEARKWFHIAAVYDGEDMLLYVDGKVVARRTIGLVTPRAVEGDPLVIGNRPPDMDRGFNGAVDDIRMYNRPLSPEEIWQLYVWKGKNLHSAALPVPAHLATDLMPSQTLGWMPGKNAAGHNLYFGTNEDAVANATTSSSEFKGSYPADINSFDTGALEFAKTYYWRIDELSGENITRGDLWQFTVIDGKASKPCPDKTLKNVDTGIKLSWTAHELAKSHDIYFGTDRDELREADVTSPAFKKNLPLKSKSFDPGPLRKGTYYYWRIDERTDFGVAKGDIWQFRTRGGSLVLQVDLAVKTCDKKDFYPGLAKPGWTIWAADAWTDMYMHDYQVFPGKPDGSLDQAGIDATGITLWMSSGSEGQLGIGAKGVCRNNLGGGGCPSGTAQGDPIANTWAYAVDWAGPYAGDILLVFRGLPAGVYELRSYHNFWEPCTQKTRNCLDCDCHMPPMPSITAKPLPPKIKDRNQNRSDNILKGYRAALPNGTGRGVTAMQNAYNVAPQHVYSDDELVPSVIIFATDGSDVLVIYQADRTKPLYPDCARKGREGARGILNAFELIQLDSAAQG